MMQPTTSIPDKATLAQRGQSLIEFALSATLLLALFCGIIDLGRAYIASVALQDAANEGAIYMSVEPACRYAMDGGRAMCDDPNNAEYRTLNSGGGDVDWTRVEVTVVRPNGYTIGDPVTVTVRYRFPLITPFISQIVGRDNLILTASATHIIISQ